MIDIVILHHSVFQKITGSSEKLLIDIAFILANSSRFIVHFIYANDENINIPLEILQNPKIRLHPFEFDGVEPNEPFKYINISIDINVLISEINPKVILLLVWGNTQNLIKNLSSSIPLILISPFGSFTTNGNVRKVYVSGASNLRKLRFRGIFNSVIFFNPIPIEMSLKNKFIKRLNSRTVIIGRSGRSDSRIFDPISIFAFAKLHLKYKNRVKFIYLNPSPEAKELVNILEIKGIEFIDWLSKEELSVFYNNIDIFAHSRRDGETLGVSIAEAMLHQNVVVTHKGMEFNDHLFLINDPYGKVVPKDNFDKYYEALDFYVKNIDKLSIWGPQAQKFANSFFDPSIISKKIIEDFVNASSYFNKPSFLIVRIWFNFQYWLYTLYYRVK